MSIHRSLLGAGLVAGVFGLVGCSAAPTAPHVAATPTHAAIGQAADPPKLTAGLVIARGILHSWDDSVSGSVTITVDGSGNFVIAFPKFTSTVKANPDVWLSTRAISPSANCNTSSTMNIDLGEHPSATQPVVVHNDPQLFLRDDPSYLKDVVLSDEGKSGPSCALPTWAVAPLVWSLPDMDPGLRVVDSGSTGGATGTVTMKDGAPFSYTVASNDLLPEVAARFGLKPADIFYLNPARAKGQDPTLFAGEVLNLSKAAR